MAVKTNQIDQSTIDEITNDWPEKPTDLTNQTVNEYGMPDEATPRRFIWHDAGVWKRIHVYRDGTPHNFPKQHEDHLRQTIDYPIDSADSDDLIEFDGSNVLWRTRGELAADCHKEPMNILTLNLANDIVTGEKSVEEARQDFAEIAIKHQLGMEPAYAQKLQFDLPQGDQGDPDESIITDAMKNKVKEELEGLTDGGESK